MISVKDRDLLDANELIFVEREIDEAIRVYHVYKRDYEKITLEHVSAERLYPVLLKYMEKGGWTYIYYKSDDRVYRSKNSIEVYFSDKPLFVDDKNEFTFNIKEYHFLHKDGDDSKNWYKGELSSFEYYKEKLGMEEEEEKDEK